MKFPITFLSLVLLCCQVRETSAQGGVPLWTNRYGGSANDIDYGNAVAVDRNGNIFVTGQAMSLNGYSDYATVAYSASGIPFWTNIYDGPGNWSDVAQAIAVSSSGNVYVTGYSYGSNAPSTVDFATVAYSSAGLPLWTNRFSGLGNDYANGIAVDANENVFVTGYSWQGSSYNYATLAYSSAGVPLWTNFYDGPGNRYDEATALTIGTNGRVYVTGYSVTGASSGVYATVGYSNSGLPLWTNRYGNDVGKNLPRAIATDNNGCVFVTGASLNDLATVAYSDTGLVLWTNRFRYSLSIADGRAMTVDRKGRVFVAGDVNVVGNSSQMVTLAYANGGAPLWTNFYSVIPNYEFSHRASAVAVDRLGNVFTAGSATIGYSNDGLPLWTNRFPGFSGSSARGMVMDPKGDLIVAGSSNEGAGFDYVTIKYASSIFATLNINRVKVNRVKGGVALSWTNAGFGLQAAPFINGTFTNVPGANSPYTNPVTGSQGFFRLVPN